MKREELIIKIKSIIATVLENENFEIKDDLSATDVDGWDSLAQLMIISKIEKKFGIKFSLNELFDLDDLGNLIELTNNKIND